MSSKLLDLLRKGLFIFACKEAFPSPETNLESLDRENKHLSNFLDSLAFGHLNDALIASQVFQSQCEKDRTLLDQLSYEEACLQVLRRFDDQLPSFLASDQCRVLDQGILPYLLAERKKMELNSSLFSELPPIQPLERREDLRTRLLFGQAVISLFKSKGAFIRNLSQGQLFFSRPYVPISFPAPKNLQKELITSIGESKETSCILLMESYDWDWAPIVHALREKSVLFVFPSANTLMHCAQFPFLVELLKSPSHGLLVLDHYPNTQLRTQPAICRKTCTAPFHWILQRQQWTSHRQSLEEDIRGCLLQDTKSLKKDTEAGDKLYRLGQNIKDSWDTERLCKQRFFALHNLHKNRNWSDPHKGNTQDQRGQSPVLINSWNTLLSTIEERTQPRPFPKEGKVHIAHIVPQLVRVGHAPTKLIRTLLKHHNREKFQLSLICTERLVFRPQEYPYDTYSSEPSVSRAGEILKEFQDNGIQVYVEDARLDYKATADRLADNLTKLKVDIAFFHGPDVINSIATRQCDVPLRVLFEHGSLPQQPGFDLVIASSEESVHRYGSHFAEMGTKIAALPFCYDATSSWEKEPPLKSLWSIPEKGKVLTTISNNLENRVHGEMCGAISQVLKEYPQAYYAPIGEIASPKEFKERFSEEVRERVIVLGSQPNPSQLARSMHLYLNEFPFGSGLSILDAMASGTPVVSMHYPEGPPQGRYGAVFMGMDKVIHSCKQEDYVDLCLRLLTDDSMYKKWSEWAAKRYSQQANPEKYVEQLESLALLTAEKSSQVSNATH